MGDITDTEEISMDETETNEEANKVEESEEHGETSIMMLIWPCVYGCLNTILF